MSYETKPKQPWTPGTWELAGPVGNAGWIQSELNSNIAAVHKIATLEGMANGKLMVAAPAMAEALAAVVHRYDTRTTDDMCRRPGERKDPPDVAACRAALDLCGWRWS